MLSRNWLVCVPIVAAICLGLAGVCLSVSGAFSVPENPAFIFRQLSSILAGNSSMKVMWLMVGHLYSPRPERASTMYARRSTLSGCSWQTYVSRPEPSILCRNETRVLRGEVDSITPQCSPINCSPGRLCLSTGYFGSYLRAPSHPQYVPHVWRYSFRSCD
jgi:hypothetical protein